MKYIITALVSSSSNAIFKIENPENFGASYYDIPHNSMRYLKVMYVKGIQRLYKTFFCGKNQVT